VAVGARAGPIGAADPFIIWGPCEVIVKQQQQQLEQQLLVAR
jgi:hypothetical protein